MSGPSPGSMLPPRLAERTRVGKPGTAREGPVLYWMRSALRGHENPALDVAIAVARHLRTRLLVLLHVEDLYPHATARRQLFLLQGAREAQAELARRGLDVHVQVDTRRCRPLLQHSLAEQAAVVVAEEPFCVPWLHGVEQLARQASRAPLWLVDCDSVVPSALVPRGACHRAYAFEQATRQLHAERIALPWEDAVVDRGCPGRFDLPASVKSLDLASADLDSLVKDTDVDGAVPPVRHTLGGSAPGYARWAAWLAGGGLKGYAKRRNDAFDLQGVSRMSAYLNAGMVSPMRIARETAAASGAGKGKFLQEFLTWRGVAYAHCFHFPMPCSGATLEQLPPWAQETLRRHASDPRRAVARERLLAGESGDRAWDGMQQYLVATGELHNNARMGWGKAVAKWAPGPREAVELLVELNNRFALDGHAPPSYGGVLGCLGLFEGPKSEGPVLGKVAYKPPKAKYAGLAAQIRSLTPAAPVIVKALARAAPVVICDDAHDTCRPLGSEDSAAVLEPEGVVEVPKSSADVGSRNVKRRWVRRLQQVDSTECIDLS